jgi:hypothetical protein
VHTATRFLQSPSDFPLTVSLGDKAPAWGLSRWAGAGLTSSACLRFIPPDDEGFALRGDRRRLVYKGRRRSHRFTILGDTAFEYDCILEKEPENNVITLLMEGTEYFDFFRQPDFIKDPFLKGSYAVYKKETFIGEGTGKLCHIHRPLIIDSRGRRVFGDLSVTGNKLCITIPETWLSEAEYPVVVDPTIGTTTVGSQTTGPDPDNSYYDRPMLDSQMSLNRYTAAQSGGGACSAYVYCYYDDTDTFVTPCLYSDSNSKPHLRKSKNEHDINIEVYDYTYNGVRYSKPAGWRNNTFEIEGSISAGQPVWFGVGPCWFTTRFDYGGVCYKLWPDWESYPEDYDSSLPPVIEISSWDTYCTIKWSWYFNYTASQSYTRTLTQGVKLTDTRKHTAAYKRAMTMNAKGVTLLGRSSNYFREHLTVLNISDTASRFRGFFRSLTEQLQTGDFISYCREFLRTVAVTVKPETRGQRTLSAQRGIVEEAGTEDSTARERGFIRTLAAAVTTGDYAGKVITLLRGIREEVSALGEAGHLGDYLRGLYTEAGAWRRHGMRGNTTGW